MSMHVGVLRVVAGADALLHHQGCCTVAPSWNGHAV